VKITRLYFIIAILLLAKSTIHAQKIGYIDYELFLSTLSEVKKVQTDLETLQADYQTKGEGMVKAFQEKYTLLIKEEMNTCFPNKDLEVKNKELQIEQQKIVDFEKEKREVVAKKTAE